MDSLYILIPITLLLLFIAIAAWLWSVKSGQFDDLDSEASRILFDDLPGDTVDDSLADFNAEQPRDRLDDRANHGHKQ